MYASRILIALPLLCTGCTALALKRHTVNQAATITDLRFQQVMNDLAAVAASPGVLPSYAPIGEGIAQIVDTAILDPKTMWQRATLKGFSSEAVSLTGQRQLQPQWTLDPAGEPQQLQAMQFALLWAVCGSPPPPCSEAELVLKHFQVYDALTRMSTGWLHFGECDQGSHKALYRGRCGNVKVWVSATGMEGLSAFTLVMQDIATVELKSLDLKHGAGTATIVYNPLSKYRVTDQTMALLTAGSVPDPLLMKVKELKDKEYNDLKAFEAALALTPDQQKYHDQIVNAAQKTAKTTVDTNLESVTAPKVPDPCGNLVERSGTRTVIVTLPTFVGDKNQVNLRLGGDFNVTEFSAGAPTYAAAPTNVVPLGAKRFSTINLRQNRAPLIPSGQ